MGRMRPAPAPFLASALLLLACNDPSSPPQTEDTGSTTSTSSSSSSSSGPDTRGDSTTAALDDTAGTGSATGTTGGTTTAPGDTSTSGSSSGPGESSESTGAAPVNGCADGEREALEDELVYPDIAACAGGFTVPGMVVNIPYCERQGGDDGPVPTGTECSVEDMCSEGWHVCLDRLEVMDAGIADCSAEAWGGSFFATRQSGMGANTCNPAGVNDVFGCGDVGYTNINGCAPLNRSSANVCVELPAPWACGVSITQEAEFIVKGGPEFGGVLCCRN
jgi:hypothetical protein